MLLRWPSGVRLVHCNRWQRTNTLRMYRTWRTVHRADRARARSEALYDVEQFRHRPPPAAPILGRGGLREHRYFKGALR